MTSPTKLFARYIVLISLGLFQVQAAGLDSSNISNLCIQTQQAIQSLIINQDQLKSGIEGNVVIANDCKKLIQANVMRYRSDEAQQALCKNSCYTSLNAKYKVLLDNDCFANEDSDAEASAKLEAASYQIACQTNADGKYCIPMLATLVANAGSNYDLCSDIVDKMGCCFQSYRQYMLLGTSESIQALDEAQKTCTESGVSGLDKVCPCGPNNAYNIHAFSNTTYCSDAWRPGSATGVIMMAMTVSTAIAVTEHTW